MDLQNEMTPDQYFEYIKDKKQSIADDDLGRIYDNCLELLNKYRITGQKKAMRKLLFHMECIEKERDLIKLGVNTFIYRDDIEEYIDVIAKDVVKIIDLESYEREIPDEIVSVVELVKDKFDGMYVLFTDYTGKVERRVSKENRSADPILFGVFQDNKSRAVVDRFYYLGDWEDEYCHLTLDRMVGEVSAARKRDITHTIRTPQDIEELKSQLNSLQHKDDGRIVVAYKAKPNIFRRIKSIFKANEDKH